MNSGKNSTNEQQQNTLKQLFRLPSGVSGPTVKNTFLASMWDKVSYLLKLFGWQVWQCFQQEENHSGPQLAPSLRALIEGNLSYKPSPHNIMYYWINQKYWITKLWINWQWNLERTSGTIYALAQTSLSSPHTSVQEPPNHLTASSS